jgi:transposase
MSTKMNEEDWTDTLAVFRACLPRRGRKAENDRRFLEALHFFTVENVRWRALPERFGPWNSVWKHFDRLSKACSASGPIFGPASSSATKATPATPTARRRGSVALLP